MRATMAGIEPRMDPARFVRVHRSYMVNLDCLSEIEPATRAADARRDATAVQPPISGRVAAIVARRIIPIRR